MASTITALTGGGGVAVAGDTSGVLELQTNNGTTAMTIDTSQNVGIGTSSPAQKLDVASKIQIDTSNSYGKIKIARATDSGVSALYIQGADNAGTANELSLVNAGGGGAAINITGGDIRFYATSNTTERMRIDSSGNVLVGTTSSTQSSTNNGGIWAQSGQQLSISTASANNNMNLYKPASASQTAFVYFWTGASAVGSITQNGNSNVAYNTSSDYRLKENVTPMTGALEKVSQLNPVNWTWKNDGTDGQGFIAHELQAVVPDCVTGEKDAVDADGNPIYQGVDTSFLVATLTAAIQELKAELDTVKAELAVLKGVNNG